CSPPPMSASAPSRPARPSPACGGTFDLEARVREVSELESRMAEPGFWDRSDAAQRTVAALKRARRSVEDWSARDAALKHLEELLALAEGEQDPSLLGEISKELDPLEQQIAELERLSLLSGEHDRLGAIVVIHPGAGGT